MKTLYVAVVVIVIIMTIIIIIIMMVFWYRGVFTGVDERDRTPSRRKEKKRKNFIK